jgi:hypothetical protein
LNGEQFSDAGASTFAEALFELRGSDAQGIKECIAVAATFHIQNCRCSVSHLSFGASSGRFDRLPPKAVVSHRCGEKVASKANARRWTLALRMGTGARFTLL